LSGEMVYRHTLNGDSLLKIYGAFSSRNSDLIQNNINFDEGVRFGLNRNLYLNSSYKNKFGNNWRYETGVCSTNEDNKNKMIEDVIKNTENSDHFKIKLKKISIDLKSLLNQNTLSPILKKITTVLQRVILAIVRTTFYSHPL
jgi:hypothetical protein